MINKNGLIKMGFKEGTAKSIIREAKESMVRKGYALYMNRRLGSVPAYAVEEIIGYEIKKEYFENGGIYNEQQKQCV